MNKYFLSFIVLFLLAGSTIEIIAQNTRVPGRGDATLRRIGYHTGNRVGISYYNDGQISGFNTGVDIRGEWPLGSGENYIGDLIPLIGLEYITNSGEVRHSVTISRGPRRGQSDERHPQFGYFWGFNPLPGFLNPNSESVAMSHLPNSWPLGGWADKPSYVDAEGKTVWNGYFGQGIAQADQESYYWADDNTDDEHNGDFLPDSRDPSRKGMGIQMSVRGFQWSSFLAANCIFWLYDIKNDGTTIFRRANFGTVVGTLAGGDGDSQDDLGFFDVNDAITYSWDADGVGNKGQKVGYVGYAFLESPGNPFDGIDNDDDSEDPNAPRFVASDFDSVKYDAGSTVVLIDALTYGRSLYTVQPGVNTVVTLGRTVTFEAGVTWFREGHIASIVNGVSVPDSSSNDGFDNDLDGLIDENRAIHLDTRVLKGLPGLKFKDYRTGRGVNAPLIDERRDNDAGNLIQSFIKGDDNVVRLITHWSGDENGNWVARDSITNEIRDDVGADGIGPLDDNYPGPDADGTEGNGRPDQGEPNFGVTDPDESDQIGLTSFNFFEQASSPDLSQDELLWNRMFPGRFDVIPPQPQDGDFIYASGYFPLAPNTIERFSVSLLYGEDEADVFRSKRIVQQIYNSGYKFPQPPRKPKLTITQDNGKAVLYWEGRNSENSIDFITKIRDFEGYKVYRSTDAGFIDSRTITNAFGVLAFNKPVAQYDIKGNGIKGFFYPSRELLEQVGGVTYYLGNDTSGIVNRYVDSTVIKGQTYYYAVAAYDRGDAAQDIFPSENSIFIFRDNTGQILTDDNTGYITPGDRGIGYVDANAETLNRLGVKTGTGNVFVEVIDASAVKPDYTYRIIFSDSTISRYTESWSLINTTTSDTVVKKSNQFGGSTPIIDGFRVQIANQNTIRINVDSSKFVGIPDTSTAKYNFAVIQVGNFRGVVKADDYIVEFSNTIVDTSLQLLIGTSNVPSQPVTFRVKRLSDNQYIKFAYARFGTQGTTYSIFIFEEIKGTNYRTWRIDIEYPIPNRPLETQGSLRLVTHKPFNSSDVFEFNVSSAYYNADLAKDELDRIKVVPNPYVVTHSNESRLLSTQTSGRGEREVRFTHIPPGSIIKIFTVRGELIRTLTHSDLYVGDVYWNLRTEENIDAAYGMYVYTVEVPNVGTKIGKLGLIK
ncbi:MAG: hypothetical protein IAE91_08345 [Ignavibacteriaceae bacterium]|nr:hypothetical protein [Ignavibacteriaceae bacterium]